MKFLQNHNKNITFDIIFRNSLDQQIAGRPIDRLDVKITVEQIQNAMLNLIKRQGLLDVLLADLGLCNLCSARNNQRQVAR
jgi:hypothetical protein